MARVWRYRTGFRVEFFANYRMDRPASLRDRFGSGESWDASFAICRFGDSEIPSRCRREDLTTLRTFSHARGKNLLNMTVRLLRTLHSHDEIVMGHKLFFTAVPGCDTVSATANTSGFTVLNAIARRFGWDFNQLHALADRANSEKAVICVQEFSPRLILVPKLRSNNRIDASRFMQEFFQVCKRIDSRVIQFTHFGFLSKTPDLGVMEEVF